MIGSLYQRAPKNSAFRRAVGVFPDDGAAIDGLTFLSNKQDSRAGEYVFSESALSDAGRSVAVAKAFSALSVSTTL